MATDNPTLESRALIFEETTFPTFSEYAIPLWGMSHYTGRVKENIMAFGKKFGKSPIHRPILDRYAASAFRYLRRLAAIQAIEVSIPLSATAVYFYFNH